MGFFLFAGASNLALCWFKVILLDDEVLLAEWVLLCVLGSERKWVGLCGWVWRWVFDWWGIGCWGIWGLCIGDCWDGSDDCWGWGVSLGWEGQSFLACPSPLSLILFRLVDVSMGVSAGKVAVVMVFCGLGVLGDELFFGWIIFLGAGWVINPFTEPSTEVPAHLEEELVSLQNDEDLKPKFKTSYQAFWMQTAIPKHYPTLWKDIKLFFIAFPTSYLVKRRFSAVSRLLTKQRNKLNITECGDLRLLLTNLHPDVDSLIAMTKPNYLIKQSSCEWLLVQFYYLFHVQFKVFVIEKC